MSNPIFKVTKFEIIRQLKKPSFWISAFLMPAVIGFCAMVGYYSSSENIDQTPNIDENTKIAITDKSGLLPDGNPLDLYETKEQGIQAIKDGDVDLFFYLPSDFAKTKNAEFYHVSESLDLFNFDGNILKSILKQYSSQKIDEVNLLAISGEYEITDNKLRPSGEPSNAIGEMIVPAIGAMIFLVFMVTVGSRLMMTVVEEKENRISEMILTAVSATHLIIGKIISMVALGVIQILALIIPMTIAIGIFRDNSLVSSLLTTAVVNPINLTTTGLVLIASILLYTGLCTMIGAITSTARDASQFIGPVVIFSVLPLYFMQGFFASEPGVIVEVLTYFPPSAPLAIFIRSAVGTIGLVELLIGLAIIILSATIVIKITITIFQKNAINFSRIQLKRKPRQHISRRN